MLSRFGQSRVIFRFPLKGKTGRNSCRKGKPLTVEMARSSVRPGRCSCSSRERQNCRVESRCGENIGKSSVMGRLNAKLNILRMFFSRWGICTDKTCSSRLKRSEVKSNHSDWETSSQASGRGTFFLEQKATFQKVTATSFCGGNYIGGDLGHQ